MGEIDRATGGSRAAKGLASRLIAIIDDDESTQSSLRDLLESMGLVAQSFGSAEETNGQKAAAATLDILERSSMSSGWLVNS